MTAKLTRRDMLKLSAGLTAGAVLVGCAPAATEAPAPTQAPAVVAEEPEAPAVEEPAVEEPAVEEPAAPPEVKIEGKVVVMHQQTEFTEDQQLAFEAEHPGVDIELIEYGGDMTKFYAMTAAGQPPDLMRVQAPSIPQFLARKLLYDLTPYFETSELLKMDDLMPVNDYYKAESPLQIGTGKIYGMVKDFSPDLTMYAYLPVFEDAGITLDDTKSYGMDEVVDMATKVMKFEGDRILVFGFFFEGGWTERYWMVGLSEVNKSLYTEGFDAMVLTGSEEAKQIVKTYYDMAVNKVTYSALNPSPGGWGGNDYLAGQLGFLQYGFWFSAMAESDVTRGKQLLLPAPNFFGVHKSPSITATGAIMSSGSQNPDAAWKVFEYYNGGQPSIDRAKSGWGVPGLKSQLPLIPQETDFQKQAYKVLQGELALNDAPVQFNPFLGENQVPNAYSKYLEMALNGQLDFDGFLKSLEDETNAAIKDGISAIMG